uniref:Uncharacterized protein n=1 Tax=Oryzias latipes TaxID=8090 RepID=A0A3P9IVL6_ORYLA
MYASTSPLVPPAPGPSPPTPLYKYTPFTNLVPYAATLPSSLITPQGFKYPPPQGFIQIYTWCIKHFITPVETVKYVQHKRLLALICLFTLCCSGFYFENSFLL